MTDRPSYLRVVGAEPVNDGLAEHAERVCEAIKTAVANECAYVVLIDEGDGWRPYWAGDQLHCFAAGEEICRAAKNELLGLT